MEKNTWRNCFENQSKKFLNNEKVKIGEGQP